MVIKNYVVPREVDERSNQVEAIAHGLALERVERRVQTIADRDDGHAAIEDDMKRKELEEDLAAYGQVGRNARVLRAAGERGLRHGNLVLLVLELEIEHDMGLFVALALREHVDFHVQIVEDLAHLFDLALHVVHVAFSFATVVQHETVRVLFFDEETRRLELRIAETHVLVQVVQTIEEISHVTAQYSFI